MSRPTVKIVLPPSDELEDFMDETGPIEEACRIFRPVGQPSRQDRRGQGRWPEHNESNGRFDDLGIPRFAASEQLLDAMIDGEIGAELILPAPSRHNGLEATRNRLRVKRLQAAGL
jgi:hypothetical protein